MSGRGRSYFREGDLKAFSCGSDAEAEASRRGRYRSWKTGEQHVQRLRGQSLNLPKSRSRAGVSTGSYVRGMVGGNLVTDRSEIL